MNKTDNGLDNIRFKLKREEDAKEKARAIKKAKEKAIAKKKAEKEAARMRELRSMSLSELNNSGAISDLCDEYGMSKTWFDRISDTESCYGAYTPGGTHNAWGWGVYDGQARNLGDNWYDASKTFIMEFSSKYGGSPSQNQMRAYCPNGAYDKYF